MQRNRITTLLPASLAILLASATASAQVTVRVSLDAGGAEGDDWSGQPSLSDDGSVVAFISRATNLVPGDGNAADDVFVLDRATAILVRASVDSGGVEADANSGNPHASGDGRYVTFWSAATNLVSDDTNGVLDVFRHEIATGVTIRASEGLFGIEADGESRFPALSQDGRYLVFQSDATNLAPGDTNGTTDVFRRDLATGTITRISVATSGAEGDGPSGDPSVSADGRWVAFESEAANLVGGDGNGDSDIFVRDVVGGVTLRLEDTGGGDPGARSDSPVISHDGRWVAFRSLAADFGPIDLNSTYDAYRYDLFTNAVDLASVDDLGGQGSAGGVVNVALSGDGRYLALSTTQDLDPADSGFWTDVYVRDLTGGTTTLVSVSSTGVPADLGCRYPAVSADGRTLAYESDATTLVPGDANGAGDAFLTSLDPGPTVYCSAKTSSAGCTPAIGSTGVPGIASGAPFVVTCTNMLSAKNGLFFFGTAGPANLPFLGGTLCALPPLTRTPIQNAGGSPSNPCSGLFQLDFDDWLATSGPAWVTAGTEVLGQYWSRDPQHPDGTGAGLSDALRFVVGP